MEIENMAILMSICCIGATIAISILLSSSKNTKIWNPPGTDEKTKLSATSIVEEAYTWYAASKQENDLQEALVRTSYGIACLRCIQTFLSLEEVDAASIPSSVGGAAGLMAKLTTQQHVLLHAIRSNGTPEK
jgi:hypothetical protein